MAPAPLRFCLDYLSPYAYLAWTRMPALAARHGRVVEPVPVLLAGLLNALGSEPVPYLLALSLAAGK